MFHGKSIQFEFVRATAFGKLVIDHIEADEVVITATGVLSFYKRTPERGEGEEALLLALAPGYWTQVKEVAIKAAPVLPQKEDYVICKAGPRKRMLGVTGIVEDVQEGNNGLLYKVQTDKHGVEVFTAMELQVLPCGEICQCLACKEDSDGEAAESA